MIGRILVIAALVCFPASCSTKDYAVERTAAAALQEICEADDGRLWGVELCGPLIIVDPATRAAWANQADGEGVLRREGGGWVGTLPAEVGVANTSVEWAGKRWIMLMASALSDDEETLRVLVAHEAWHRVQDTIGLAAQSSQCAHLESERGRYLLRLELRALRSALTSSGKARWRAARDALAFRAARMDEFADAAAEEAALDRNEGLAAYTGVKLGAADEAFAYAARTFEDYDDHDAYARSYAYASGPAYGLLLDERVDDWRKSLGTRAPADLLAEAMDASAASDLTAAAARYDGATIAAEEEARAEAQRARIAELRARFADGPRLEMPLAEMQMQFDPNQLTPVEDLGTVYGVLKLRDKWGALDAQDGALISSDFTLAIVAAPDASTLAGPGWRLTLDPGYRVAPTDRQGVLRVVPDESAE